MLETGRACSAVTADGANLGLAIIFVFLGSWRCMAEDDSGGINPFAVCRIFGTVFAPTGINWGPTPLGITLEAG